MIVYKLTNQKMQTHGGYQWEPGVARETDGEGNLCCPGWLHYYHDPLLAVLLNPIHADIEGPILWEAEAEGLHRDDRGLKGGCTRLTLLRRIELPQITTEQRVRFGILCAKVICDNPAWNAWADRWLDGSDRSQESAWAAIEAAARAAEAAWAAETAAWAAAETAARAAETAARAAEAAWAAAETAARAARAAWAAAETAARAAEAAWAAARAAWAARAAAEAAWVARAAEAAEGTPLDLIAIASAALKGPEE